MLPSRSERLGLIALSVVGTLYVWEVAASAIFCWRTGLWNLFTFPYLQWARAALVAQDMLLWPGFRTFARHDIWNIRWPLMWLVLSALFPTLVLAWSVIAIRMFRRPLRQPTVRYDQPLHGQSEFARPEHLKSTNFNVRRNIFPS